MCTEKGSDLIRCNKVTQLLCHIETERKGGVKQQDCVGNHGSQPWTRLGAWTRADGEVGGEAQFWVCC